jgi:hypothetical protein
VLERLEATALGMPVPTLDCLKLGIVKRKNPLWGTIAWREAVGAILAVGLRAGGEAQKISREVVDYLVGLGFYEYRDLLRPKVGPRNAG